MVILLNDNELGALAGQPYIITALYLYLRRLMDFKSGITGLKRGISYQSISEALYIEPERGIQSGSPHKSTIRRAIERAERAGLIKSIGNAEQLVFKLRIAEQSNSVQKQADTKPTPHPDTAEAATHKAYSTKADTPKTAQADTPLRSENNITIPPPPSIVTSYAEPQKSVVVEMEYLIYPEGLSKDHRKIVTKHIQGLQADVQQDLLDELAGAIGYGKVRNPLAYLREIASKARAGLFIPELAYSVRQQRLRRLEIQQAQEQSNIHAAPTAPKPKAIRKKPEGMNSVRDYLNNLKKANV